MHVSREIVSASEKKQNNPNTFLRQSDPYWLAAAAGLIIDATATVCCDAIAARMIRAFTNVCVGGALVYSGSSELRNRKKGNSFSPWAKIILGSGYMLWSTYDASALLSVSSKPNPSKPTSFTKEKIVAIGDVHGDLEGLKMNLKEAQLIDEKGNWIGGDRVFVQLGDVVDRGPKAKECWAYLRVLQKQALAVGGKVIRIAGNHELMWLEKDFRYVNQVADTDATRKLVSQWIHDDILNCRQVPDSEPTCDVQAAYLSMGGQISFLHAGLTEELAQKLREEIAKNTGRGPEKVENEDLVNKINALLKEAVRTNTFTHPIFQAGATRNGHGIDGVFWADRAVLDRQAFDSMIQIVGHNPPHGREEPIRMSPNHRVIYADAGMFKHYGENRCFVKIDQSSLSARCKKDTQWFDHPLL